jgi:hypothetical protein
VQLYILLVFVKNSVAIELLSFLILPDRYSP